MSEAVTDLVNYLKVIASLHDPKHPEWAYESYEALVLDQGVIYTEARGAKSGPYRECFTNAYYAAEDHDWTYVEGYATSLIPVAHAWCLDEAGIVVETTWDEPGDAYIGIPFDTEWVIKIAVETGHWGVLGNDWMRDVALLRHGLPKEALI